MQKKSDQFIIVVFILLNISLIVIKHVEREPGLGAANFPGWIPYVGANTSGLFLALQLIILLS